MTSEEIQKHIAEGTCFKCGGNFGPMHRCPPKTLQILIGNEDDDPGETFHDAVEERMEENEENEVLALQQIQQSELTSNWLYSYQTMKIFGHIEDRRVKVMIDSGASHCFISNEVASKLQLKVTPTQQFSVTLSNGKKIKAGGICREVPLRIESNVFTVTCYVFPLSNVDIILGVSWLANLGKVKANWQTFTMEFMTNGKSNRLIGDPAEIRHSPAVCIHREKCATSRPPMIVGSCGHCTGPH